MTLIDLHIHTTASDGLSDPPALIDQLQASGIAVFAVTDHDSVAAVPQLAEAATRARLRFIPGIEITAVDRGRDIHILGYFIDPASEALTALLERSRRDRLRRGRLMCEQLTAAGAPLAFETLQGGLPGAAERVISRPLVADALVAAGHVASRQEAFDRFLGEGRPGYVPRIGASPRDVVAIIEEAGGVSSLAHPGVTRRDDLIGPLVDSGLGAIECFHSDHDCRTTSAYLDLARHYGVAVTGGSDFHGAGTRRAEWFGRIGLPAEHLATLIARHEATVGSMARR